MIISAHKKWKISEYEWFMHGFEEIILIKYVAVGQTDQYHVDKLKCCLEEFFKEFLLRYLY